MRPTALVLLLLVLPAAPAQTEKIDREVRAKLDTVRYLHKLEAPAGGFAPAPDGKPGLRATSAAVRALKYNGAKVPNPERHAAFVMSCFDPATGGFADAPGGKADVTLTSVGVMAAAELGVPKDRYRKALDYLKANAKTFEEVRIAAAGVEAWGVKDAPFDVKPWVEAGWKHYESAVATDWREIGSGVALGLRLGGDPGPELRRVLADLLSGSQLPDGGWGRADAKASDLETTYRIMRALKLLNRRPAEPARLRAFVASCRTADGGYAAKPGDPSNVGGTYYAAIVLHWLGESAK